MADLYPTFDIPADVDDTTEDAVTYGTSWAFDFIAGDFVITAGKLLPIDGYRAWAQWCVKNVLTTRFAHVIFSDDYGTDFELARSASSRAEAELLISTEIRDSLEQDERTGSVHSFDFDWQGDALNLSFVIEPTEGTAERIHVDLKGVS